jgi:hypothetical protein
MKFEVQANEDYEAWVNKEVKVKIFYANTRKYNFSALHYF